MSEARTRRDPVTEERNGATNGRVNGHPQNGTQSPQTSMALQQQMDMLQQQQQVNQMNLQQQMQTYDLQCGNHDLVVGVQAIGALAQPLSAMSPFLNSILGEMAELCVEKNSDYSFVDLDITISNEDE